MRDDEAYLLRLTRAIDELDEGIMRGLKNETRTHDWHIVQLADLRDYFLYLTLDALEDPDLAKVLVSRLELCERESKTHAKFFFGLAQLLSVKHQIAEVPGERIHREEFEESWQRTARELGLDKESD